MLRAADLTQVEEIIPGMSLIGGGFERSETDAITGSFARHLMSGFDQWNERGFSPIADAYLARLPKRKAGERRSIDRNGDLLANMPADRGGPDRTSFLRELARAAWYDPVLRGPKL